ncbi:MAG TPA: hypothetical protein VI248_20335 [Kineosporiaceae bacterium]
MSMKDACLEVFRAMAPGAWISVDDLAYQVRELTQADCETGSVARAAHAARDALAARHELGVGSYQDGYRRLDATGQVAAVDKLKRKFLIGLVRIGDYAGAALERAELTQEQRHRMQAAVRVAAWQEDLEARRARRRRPLPPPG